jgi:hypothetical protein
MSKVLIVLRRATSSATFLNDVLNAIRTVFAFAIVVFALVQSMSAQASELQSRTWDISLWAAGATGEENTNSFSEAQIFTAGVFVGKVLTDEIGSGWPRGRLEFGFDVAPLFVQLRPQRIYGESFDPVVLRWNSSLRRGRVAPFIELSGGAVRTPSNFPVGDSSNFNFIARGGGGVLISMRRDQALEIGCRWWHISNANLGNRNPEFNGIQVSVGWHWFK